MKLNKILILFVIIGCILTFGYITKIIGAKTIENTTTSYIHTTIDPQKSTTTDNSPGQILISIGNYNALLPVYIDNTKYGNVSGGNPLNLKLSEGSKNVSVCAGTVCESVDVDIIAGIKMTVDFEEKLTQDLPQAALNVSVGNYKGILPVFIDNMSVGNISSGMPFVQTVSSGYHVVKICTNDNCFTDTVKVTPPNQTFIDFEDQLESGELLADLTVSIGGYDAKLPVLIDNETVGIVSQENPLTIRTTVGTHDVKVCSGTICEEDQVNMKFAKQTFIDFGDQLKKDAEFTEPTVRIIDGFVNANTMTVDAEFINPTTKDLTMTATISDTYTYKDYSSNVRIGSSAQIIQSEFVKAGDRTNYQFNIYLSGGDSIIASEPVVIDLTTQ